MKYKSYNINKLKKEIKDESVYNICRKREIDFTRNRKITTKDLYITPLIIEVKQPKWNYIEEFNLEKVSDVALLKQREKLNKM